MITDDLFSWGSREYDYIALRALVLEPAWTRHPVLDSPASCKTGQICNFQLLLRYSTEYQEEMGEGARLQYLVEDTAHREVVYVWDVATHVYSKHLATLLVEVAAEFYSKSTCLSKIFTGRHISYSHFSLFLCPLLNWPLFPFFLSFFPLWLTARICHWSLCQEFWSGN